MFFSLGVVSAALTFSAAAIPFSSGEVLNIPLIKRSELKNADGIVNLDFLNNNLRSAIAKIQRGFANYERNTGRVHSLALNMPTKRATALEPLMAESNLWQGSISVGTPPENFTVLFDSGSTDFFLPGPNCTMNCAGHKSYNPASSSTYKSIGATFTLSYGDGSSVVGLTATDTVRVAGLSATNQTLGVASQYSNGFSGSNFPPDGLMGLAWTQLSVYRAPGYFQTLVAEGKVNSPVFGFKLAPTGSELSLGKVDPSLYTGSFTHASVTEQAYWQVLLDAISVGSKVLVTSVPAIIDTGTTLIIGPTSQVAAFYGSVPGSASAPQYGSGIYTIPCDAVPSVSLTFSLKNFPISAATFNYGKISDNICIGGIVASTGINFWVVGDVFLQNVYTKFDVGGSRVGFASLK